MSQGSWLCGRIGVDNTGGWTDSSYTKQIAGQSLASAYQIVGLCVWPDTSILCSHHLLKGVIGEEMWLYSVFHASVSLCHHDCLAKKKNQTKCEKTRQWNIHRFIFLNAFSFYYNTLCTTEKYSLYLLVRKTVQIKE